MRWLIFAIFVYIALALDVGLRTLPVWSIQTNNGTVSPDLVLLLGIYFSLWAPPRTAAWVMLILGLLVDLTTSHFTPAAMVSGHPGPQVMTILGPNALGYVAGAYAVVQLRGLLYRESPMAVAIIVFAAGIVVNLVAVLLLTLRGVRWFLAEPIPNWVASAQLVHYFLILLYTSVVAGLLSKPLSYVRGWWGLETPKSHGFHR